jgi:PPIC-type PPIASE domain/SurA-like N-terminal domain
MAKPVRSKSEKEQTKKQIALSARQRQQKKKLFIGLGALAALVVLVALVGVYDNFVAKPATPVATVNGATIRLDQYQTRLRYERYTLDTLTRNIDAQLANLDPADSATEFLSQYFQQIRSQVVQQRVGLPRQLVDDMVEGTLARQKAAEVGVTASEDEVTEVLRARMAQQVGYVTQSQATAIASTAVAETATAQLFTPTPLPTATPTLTVTVVTTATAVITPTEETTPVPTPTRHIISEDEFSQQYAAYLKDLQEQAGVTEADLRGYVRDDLLITALRKWFADQAPKEAEQVHVSHIQAATEAQADLAMSRLEKGEDFALVASQVSSNTVTAADGGELGWFMKGQLATRYNAQLEETAFSLEAGSYSQPITSTVGWQIIKLTERGVHPLNETQLLTKQAEGYSNWLEESKKSGVQIHWQSDMAPVDTSLVQEQSG